MVVGILEIMKCAHVFDFLSIKHRQRRGPQILVGDSLFLEVINLVDAKLLILKRGLISHRRGRHSNQQRDAKQQTDNKPNADPSGHGGIIESSIVRTEELKIISAIPSGVTGYLIKFSNCGMIASAHNS